MNIPRSVLKPFGYTGIPTVDLSRNVLYTIDLRLETWWYNLWDEPRFLISIPWVIKNLKKVATFYGADEVDVLFIPSHHSTKMSMLVSYSVNGKKNATRLYG